MRGKTTAVSVVAYAETPPHALRHTNKSGLLVLLRQNSTRRRDKVCRHHRLVPRLSGLDREAYHPLCVITGLVPIGAKNLAMA